ncbi:MAG TPA: polyketide synthase, partial [Candidatus Portnoybacteria bacterium]|nr:polyketide synthase [Candidatus Portnoybacteria bacterium]
MKYNSNQFDIAIIGLSSVFPGSENSGSYWNNLKKSKELIHYFSGETSREDRKDLFPSIVGKFIPARGIINNIEYFDARFFGYSFEEARISDPQLRLLMECAWTALENSCYNPQKHKESIGIFVGAGNNNYWLDKVKKVIKINSINDHDYWQLIDKDFFATKIAYKLNLNGPALNIGAACSSSLAAIHLASRSLLGGECDLALAGGVSISSFEKRGYFYNEGSVFSSNGHNQTFDAQASGTVFSDGLGVVVLKRLSDALADGDNILAVIKGSAINNDGSNKASYSAPSVDGQASVIADAIHFAQTPPETITYVEAHGTATKLGD